MMYIPIYGNMSPTGSDSEPGEEVCSGHDTQRQDRRGTDRGELQGEHLQLITLCISVWCTRKVLLTSMFGRCAKNITDSIKCVDL